MQYPKESNKKVVTIFGPEGIRRGRIYQNLRCREGHLERRENFEGKKLGEQIFFSSYHLLPRNLYWSNLTGSEKTRKNLDISYTD